MCIDLRLFDASLSLCILVVYHARHIHRGPLWMHILSLVFSTACYIIAFIVLKGDTSETVASVKIVLWYFPLLFEVASHFVANKLPGHVRYSAEGIIGRSGTVFIIILGGGLDKITTGFQDIVGNTGLGKDSTGLFLSAAVIFLVTFLLYFGSTGGSRKLGNQRSLAWFFAHIFYLAAVIITLQGIAAALSFSNFGHALFVQITSTFDTFKFLVDHPGVNLTAADIPGPQLTLAKIGISADTYITALNEAIIRAVRENNTDVLANTVLQLDMAVVEVLLVRFKAQPDDDSFLWAKLHTFLTSDVANSTVINVPEFTTLLSGIIEWRGSSAMWFYGAAGSTLLTLVMLTLIKGSPRDKCSIIIRLIVGVGVTCLSFLSIGGSKPVLDRDINLTKSKIWIIFLSDWLLPFFAILLALLQVVEYSLVHMAYRSYFKPDVIDSESPASLA